MIWHFFHKYSLSLFGAAPVFLCLALFTLLVVGAFAKNYLQGEVGRWRFWLLFAAFSTGILVCGWAGNLETFFFGWEIVGLASFFLIGFYQSNPRSLENSLIALANYKICDLFFVLAIFLLESHQTYWAGACLIMATLAKSAQVPFSSWLYRALEGPTPSSTVFYGGLSLHLGAFLLLQYSSIWESYDSLRVLLGFIGLISGAYGFLVGLTRSDVKTSFAFASVSQVGLIYFELACGFYSLALWHIVGHNLLRTWNYLRSASFFEDFFRPEHHKPKEFRFLSHLLPKQFYVHALNGFYLDWMFIILRNGGLLFVLLGASWVLGDLSRQGQFHPEFVLLFVSALLAVYNFIFPKVRVIRQVYFLISSQLGLLLSIHWFFVDLIEETYLFFSLLFLAGILATLWPALQLWYREGSRNGDRFLGLGTVYPWRHGLYLLCCLSVSGSPGSLQFFLQEVLLDELWTKSYAFMVLALVILTLNSYQFFRLGQHAFFGRAGQSA